MGEVKVHILAKLKIYEDCRFRVSIKDPFAVIFASLFYCNFIEGKYLRTFV